MKYQKVPLKFDLYADYEIPQEYLAWSIEVDHIDQNRIDDIEYDLQVTGHKIFHIEVVRSTDGLFDIKVIVAKSNIIF